MQKFLLRRAWIGILVGIFLILLLPNALLRSWLPVSGSIPTPTLEPTTNRLEQSFQDGLILAASDPLAALPILQEVGFSSSPKADAARAIAQAIQSARLADDPAYLLTASGQALAAMDEWRLAQEAFLHAVELDPDYAEAWAFLGEAQQQMGEDGYPALQRAIELNSQSIAARLFMALYWQRQQAYATAQVHYRLAAQLEPENPSIQLQWGQNSLLAGEIVEAREHFGIAADLTEDDLGVWTYVARFCIDSELFVEELGLPAALTVLKEQPENANAMVLVARAYLALDKPVTANVYFAQAVELFPDFMPAHYYYALFLLASDELDNAFRHLNKVIELAPGTSEAELAADLIVRYSH